MHSAFPGTAGPPRLQPMLAWSGPMPEGPGWSFEFKWRGARTLAAIHQTGHVSLRSRNDNDVTASYPELAVLGELLPGRTALLDGEIVALDNAGRPDFARLQARFGTRPTAGLVARVPVTFFAFDLLFLDGQLWTDTPYKRRRTRLDELELRQLPRVDTPPAFTDLDGHTLLHVAADHALEGVVAKWSDSRYLPGRTSRSWIKVPLRHTHEAIIGGWTPGSGHHARTLGSVLLGAYDQYERLRYLGHVGTGFTDRHRDQLHAALLELAEPASPFAEPLPREHIRQARWVLPILVCDIEFRTWSPQGRLRHPAWRGLRPDRNAADIHLA